MFYRQLDRARLFAYTRRLLIALGLGAAADVAAALGLGLLLARPGLGLGAVAAVARAVRAVAAGRLLGGRGLEHAVQALGAALHQAEFLEALQDHRQLRREDGSLILFLRSGCGKGFCDFEGVFVPGTLKRGYVGQMG